MSTPPPNPAGDAPAPRFDDPTRDIRLPSLPDRPQAVVRPEWQAHVRTNVADPSVPPLAEHPAPASEDARDATAVVSAPLSEPAPPRPYVLPDEPTDQLSSPPQGRQPTLAFDAPAAAAPAPHVSSNATPGQGSPQFGAAPFGAPSAGSPGHGGRSYGPPPSSGPSPRVVARDRKRRWPWVVLTVLPILVILAAGVLLFFLFGAA